MRDRWRAGRSPQLDVDDPALVVVVTAFDDAEAASAALARATGWRAEEPAVLRHHLTLPAGAVARARELLAQDGWRLDEVPERDRAGDDGDGLPGRGEGRPPGDRPSGTDAAPDRPDRPDHARARAAGTGETGAGETTGAAGDLVRLVAVRVQKLDALHCAQERSRMASLAQRLGGDASGWDALQLPGADR
ncbi:hypothetical protein [Streptoalloteichus tenebrarius]|uniref:hypothetical protein n=1 Tax=Streptoalloteichus tenebrarius (strain ATCC 17920 / DSM 40477 / JCM 4838 / CBS 697.72 / NBRC 16177 / NCIMB 11028 / NRRL B-12390 / A12253. 1 / ISP 5477) TaxID=1933 RepID=UPI003557BB5F